MLSVAKVQNIFHSPSNDWQEKSVSIEKYLVISEK
jgi:hypothetical protein